MPTLQEIANRMSLDASTLAFVQVDAIEIDPSALPEILESKVSDTVFHSVSVQDEVL